MGVRTAVRRGAAVLACACAGLALAPAGAPAQIPLPPLPGTPPPPGQPPPDERPDPQPAPPAPVSPAPGSVTEGVDVAHTGFYADDALVPPLVRRWSVEASGNVILAADGRVYVTRPGLTLALDQRDGKVLWSIPEGGERAGYGDGTLFVAVGETLRAYRADSGAQLWSRPGARRGYFAGPVASGGFVYSVDHDDYKLHALRAGDGSQVWENELTTSGAGAPAVSDQRVFVAGVCADGEAIDRASGKDVWNRDSPCSGGGLVAPALEGGRLWVPSDDYSDPDRRMPVLDAATGGPLRHYESQARERPVFVDGLAVFGQPWLRALSADSGTQAWEASKERQLTSPIAIGHDIYGFGDVDGRHSLVAFDSERGERVWSTTRGLEAVHPQDSDRKLAAAPGLLIVQAGQRISAWSSALRPAPKGIAIGTSTRFVSPHAPFGLTGVLGSELRGKRQKVALEGADWPRRRFRRFATATALRDGGFFDGIRTGRNARLRVSAGGAHSNVITIYVYPRVRLTRPIGTPRRAKLFAHVRARGVGLNGRTLVLYYQRRGKGRLTRLGSGRLRGRRRGRATAPIVFRPPRRGSSRDLVWHCIKGQLRLGLGRPSPLTRRCGARTLRRP